MTGTLEGDDGLRRCPWGALPALRAYHDTEWGLPVDDESALFERLCLEGFQAGLSWLTILNKRERYREVFHGFDADRVSALTDDDVERLVQDPGIVRNRAKIEAARRNALSTVALRDDGGLAAFIEKFAPSQTPAPTDTDELPGSSPESQALSKALKKRGFAFVGPTTMYALMEATGMVDTHLVDCFRRGSSGRWSTT
jgi:DNA-3-methyladenine glycosylase I